MRWFVDRFVLSFTSHQARERDFGPAAPWSQWPSGIHLAAIKSQEL
jgi:hypothetical protein